MSNNDILRQAIHCHQTGRFQEAERLYLSILQIQPGRSDVNHNLGLLFMQMGRPEAGLPHLQNAWEKGPRNEQCCLTLTECLLQLDRSNNALHFIANAIEREGYDSVRAKYLLQLSTCITKNECPSLKTEHELLALFGAGHHEDLERKLYFLLERHPKWGDGWDILCTTMQILGKDCEDALEHALKLMPDNPDAQSQRKIFCVGANKTGTTSLESVFKSLGLLVGNQAKAEMLIHDWGRQDYRRIIRHCQSAEAFQDAPFSVPGTFKELDRAFPNSKFILTMRNNANEWYDSLVRFHSKIVGKGRIPTAADLRQFNYRYPGFVFDAIGLVYGANEAMPYNRQGYIENYNDHNNQVKEYFKGRPDDLLVLNIAEPDAMEMLLKFLGYPYSGQKMPHMNSSK